MENDNENLQALRSLNIQYDTFTTRLKKPILDINEAANIIENTELFIQKIRDHSYLDESLKKINLNDYVGYKSISELTQRAETEFPSLIFANIISPTVASLSRKSKNPLSNKELKINEETLAKIKKMTIHELSETQKKSSVVSTYFNEHVNKYASDLYSSYNQLFLDLTAETDKQLHNQTSVKKSFSFQDVTQLIQRLIPMRSASLNVADFEADKTFATHSQPQVSSQQPSNSNNQNEAQKHTETKEQTNTIGMNSST